MVVYCRPARFGVGGGVSWPGEGGRGQPSREQARKRARASEGREQEGVRRYEMSRKRRDKGMSFLDSSSPRKAHDDATVGSRLGEDGPVSTRCTLFVISSRR